MKIAPLVCSLCLAGLTQAAEETKFLMDFKIMEAPAEWIQKNRLEKPPIEIKPTLFLAAAKEKGMDILSAPSILALGNQDARIEIGEEAPSYMEKTANGYELRKLPDELAPGLSISVKASQIPGKPGQCRLEWKASIATLVERIPMPGVNLDVGKPVVNNQEAASTTDCFNGKWMLLTRMDPLDKQSDKPVLIFVRVDVVTSEGTPAKPELQVDLHADEISRDQKTGVIHSKGNVRLKEGDLVIYSNELRIKPRTHSDPGVQADTLSFETPEGRIRLDGNVRFRTASGLVTADQLIIDRSAPTPAKKASPLEEKLKTIIIPTLEMQNVTLADAFMYLTEVSKNGRADKTGVDFIIKGEAAKKAQITISLRQVPLYDAVRYMTEVSGTTFRVDERAVVIE